MTCADHEVDALEREVLQRAKLREDYQQLLTVSGIGKVLALTIALETGDVKRFATAGNFASYARMVDSRRESNGKTKGVGNTKCGNKYLAWAFIEAAHFAIRYDEAIKRFYQKKSAKIPAIVAIKAVAHKLARACFHVMHEGVPFDVVTNWPEYNDPLRRSGDITICLPKRRWESRRQKVNAQRPSIFGCPRPFTCVERNST